MESMEFGKRVEMELKENILKFWMKHTVDRENGGFYGKISNDLHVDKKAPKGLVLNTRILWTYSAAYGLYGNPEYLEMADRAYDYISKYFWDEEYKGGYWMLDYMGNPLDARKQTYGEAFTIYSLSEYYRATKNQAGLDKAIELYHALNRYAYDSENKGYFEKFTREWMDDSRLSLNAADIEGSKKTMDTHLHLMEAFTNLFRVWKSPDLENKLKEIIEVFIKHIIDHSSGHFKTFFDEKWNSLNDHISFGHDIEGSWLLMEAAEVLGDRELIKQVKTIGVHMAQACLAEGMDSDGAMFYEANPREIFAKHKDWWVQSEAVVGFLNAFQQTGDKKFYDAAVKCWTFIEDYLVDRVHGEWLHGLNEGGSLPAPHEAKVHNWKCPYHNSRACFEVLERLGSIAC